MALASIATAPHIPQLTLGLSSFGLKCSLRSSVSAQYLLLFMVTCVVLCCRQLSCRTSTGSSCSKDGLFTKVLGSIWQWVAESGRWLTFHKVSSAANLSDEIGTDDWSEGEKLRCDKAKLEFEPFYKWLQGLSSRHPCPVSTSFLRLAKQLANKTRRCHTPKSSTACGAMFEAHQGCQGSQTPDC